MGSKVHMICAKCGSDEMHFAFSKPEYGDTGVAIICENCAELTGTDEWNEFNDRLDHNPDYDEENDTLIYKKKH